jgi:hypothetical protein
MFLYFIQNLQKPSVIATSIKIRTATQSAFQWRQLRLELHPSPMTCGMPALKLFQRFAKSIALPLIFCRSICVCAMK